MAKIKKIKEGTATVYPATIPQAVIDPTSGKSVRTELNEKEIASNKKTTLTNSDTDYPTTKVLTTVKTDIENELSNKMDKSSFVFISEEAYNTLVLDGLIDANVVYNIYEV